MSESPGRRLRRAALIVPLALSLTLAGCGGDGTGSGSGGGGGGETSSETIDAATKLLDDAAAGAVTGPSFGPIKVADIVPWSADMMPTPEPLPEGEKPSVTIVYGLAVGEGPYLAQLIATIAEQVGWTAKVVQATDQSQASSLAALTQAVNEKPTAIISLVIPGVWVGGALAAAKEAGIYTVNVHQDSTTGPGYDAYVPNAEGVQKTLMAAFAVKDSDGKASSLLFDAPGFSDANMPAALTYLSDCGGCSTEAVQINPMDFIDPVKLQSNITAALASHPGTNYLMWPTASLPLQPVVAGIRSSTSKDAKLVTNGAGPAPIALVKDGTLPILVQSPNSLLALTAIDDVSRLIQGKPPVAEDAIRLPVTYWTKDTAPDAPDFAAITETQLANDFVTPFEEAWGVDLKEAILGVTG